MELYYYFKDYVKDKFYEELLPLSPAMRAATIYKHTCELIPIKIEDGDLIAGRYAVTDTPEEYSYEKRDFPFTDARSDAEINAMREFLERFGTTARFDKGHFLADYEAIITKGLCSYEKRVTRELSLPTLGEEKRELLSAMLVSFEAVKIYTNRFVTLAEELYEKCGGEWLLKIRDAYKKVPYEPAESIYEAICSVWIMHSLLPISDDSWASISLGRMDKYLYPFYEKSLSEGEVRKSVKEYLLCLFRLLNSYGDGACTLNIGGLSPEGEDETSELSYLIVEVEKEILGASPILAVRVHDKSPDELLSSVITKELFTIGQPTFYGELACLRALVDRGVPESDAHRFAANSCMGIYMPGEEIASMWGCIFNMHLPLELAVNGGEPLVLPLPIKVSAASTPASLNELFSEYKKYLGELFDYLFAINRKNAKNRAISTPNPLLSALTSGCIERGLDRALGAKYNTETVETVALVNTANAIAAIDTLVFREKKYTLGEITAAAKADFQGYEDILRDIKRCDKYGTASSYADGIAARLCEITASLCKERSRDNVYFLPSLHTLDLNASFGEKLYTTLDGRLRGVPVAKNAGPTNDVRTSEPTKIALSAASLPQERFSGGQPIDLYFDREALESEDGKKSILALVKSYAKLGGLQLQVNSVDIALLEAAYECPEKYPELTVRIGGYSEKFTKLKKSSQKEFIERFKMESKK